MSKKTCFITNLALSLRLMKLIQTKNNNYERKRTLSYDK